ncbi:30S ribosomal protein S18 [Patescibacteria group bacterium]|nr:30S ribosomal protein S18 [Patescibacteria group bacterium]
MLKNNQAKFTYKDPATLCRFVSEQGYISPRVKTGLSQKLQRKLAREIKRARHLAMLPFTQTV